MTPRGPRDGHEARVRRRLTATETDFEALRQRAAVVGVATGAQGAEEAEASLDELVALADTAGAEVVHRILQSRGAPDPATYVGRGKLEELAAASPGLDLDLVIFDDELTPAQQRNLEKALSVDVVDRVALILDIFAQHATTREGMLQVELAQLRYRLPRLRGRGVQMSRLAGGIGTRGPGETQLEVDRRRIQRRMAHLERERDKLERTRETQRKARIRREIPLVALVGYTNAGKSTLLNELTGAGVLTEHQLFTTLDPRVRKLRLPGGEEVLLADTVGFVKKLPHELVEAFRSTLEEVRSADLLLHVIDGAAHGVERHLAAVRDVLAEIGADHVPELFVVNKLDVAPPQAVQEVSRLHEDVVGISAATGEGADKLLEAVQRKLRSLMEIVELAVPWDRGDILAGLHREGEVLVEHHGPDGAHVRARLPDEAIVRFGQWIVQEPGPERPSERRVAG
ncbi:MAG: GTPase HflX [Actinobacteria bacterium]|nr:GTPase HflX [Actinomycetota bacterium]